MSVRRFGSLVCLVFVIGALCAAKPARSASPLTEDEVERFVSSYLPITLKASEYWNERKYTKYGTDLPPKRSYERAAAEMEAAGTYSEFQEILESHGFGNFEEWMSLKHRFALAQLAIASEHRGQPINSERYLKRRRMAEKQIEKIQENKEGLPPKEVEARVISYQVFVDSLDEKLRSVEDAETLRPFTERFAAVYDETTRQLGYEPVQDFETGVLESLKESIGAFGAWIMELFSPGKA